MRCSLMLSSLLFGLVSLAQPAGAEPAGAQPSRSLKIDLALPPSGAGALEVELTFEGLAAGESIIEVVDDWGGSIFQAGIIEDVRLVPGDGEGEPTPIELIEAPHAWRVEHAGKAPLRVRYAVPANEHIRGLDGDSYYKPIVTDGLVHLIGHQSLLLPRAWEDDAAIDVTLRWSGLPEGASAVTSFGVGAGPFRFQASKETLRRGLYVAGQGDFFEGAGEDPVHVFVARGPWRFEPKQLADMAQKIVAAERDFFGEENAGAFLVTAIAIGPEQPEHLSYGGTGLEDAFATFIVPVLQLDDEGREGLHYLLAHEKAHTWIGGLIATGEEPEPAGYWFSEGVTDYYTPRLLHHAGLMTPQQVIEQWNGYLRNYFLSPASEATNQQVADGFWNDRDLQQLAYMRGAAVTFYLDQARRQRTGGETRFDQWLFGELELARAEGRQRKLTNDELRSGLAAGWTAEEMKSSFGTLIDGELLELPDDLLAPCAKLAWHEETTFQLGFEVDESTREITSVEKGSNAHLVGLRAGQRLASWSIRYGRPDVEVVLHRKTEDGEQEVRFLPAGPKRQIPRFELADAAACVALM